MWSEISMQEGIKGLARPHLVGVSGIHRVRPPHLRLTCETNCKLMQTILDGFAIRKREIMLERQREGIAKAKAEGKYKGRKPTVAVQAGQIRALHAAGDKPAHIARRLGVARSSVYRMLESGTAL